MEESQIAAASASVFLASSTSPITPKRSYVIRGTTYCCKKKIHTGLGTAVGRYPPCRPSLSWDPPQTNQSLLCMWFGGFGIRKQNNSSATTLWEAESAAPSDPTGPPTRHLSTRTCVILTCTFNLMSANLFRDELQVLDHHNSVISRIISFKAVIIAVRPVVYSKNSDTEEGSLIQTSKRMYPGKSFQLHVELQHVTAL